MTKHLFSMQLAKHKQMNFLKNDSVFPGWEFVWFI